MVRQQKNEELMAAGVTLIDPATTYIDSDVEIGPDTVIHPCVFIERGTKIGAACEIHAGSRIVNSTIGDRVVIRNHSVITDATVAAGATVGPFAHLRPGADIGERRPRRQLRRAQEDHAGRRQQGQSPGLPRRRDDRRQRQRRRRHDHLQLRRRAKHQTVIEDGAFIGSNSTLVAPVTVGRERVRRRRLGHHRRCAGRRARHRARPAGEQAGWVERRKDRSETVLRSPAL